MITYVPDIDQEGSKCYKSQETYDGEKTVVGDGEDLIADVMVRPEYQEHRDAPVLPYGDGQKSSDLDAPLTTQSGKVIVPIFSSLVRRCADMMI